VSSLDRTRDAIDLVPATVDAPGLVEHAVFGEDLVDDCAPTRGRFHRTRREDYGSARSICCRRWLVSSRIECGDPFRCLKLPEAQLHVSSCPIEHFGGISELLPGKLTTLSNSIGYVFTGSTLGNSKALPQRTPKMPSVIMGKRCEATQHPTELLGRRPV
jgi:hypothetical protein